MDLSALLWQLYGNAGERPLATIEQYYVYAWLRTRREVLRRMRVRAMPRHTVRYCTPHIDAPSRLRAASGER